MPAEASYQVFWLEAARQELRQAVDTVSVSDLREEITRTVRSLDQRLRTEPLLVGEVYFSRGAIRKHLAVQGVIAIDFSVDTQRKLVGVRRCRVRSRDGF